MGRVIKFIIMILLLAGMAYMGLAIYANCVAGDSTGKYDIPDRADATHWVQVANTGNILFSSDVEVTGTPGSRIITLTGFWELVKKKYKYREGTITLDERVFGRITVRKR